MRTFVRLLCVVAFTVTAQPLAAPRSAADVAPARELPKPNYDLASRWTSAKVGKIRVLDGGDAALARVQRSLLVQLRDAGRA